MILFLSTVGNMLAFIVVELYIFFWLAVDSKVLNLVSYVAKCLMGRKSVVGSSNVP